MPPKLALLGCVFFVAWLFRTGQAKRAGCSAALWIPLIWLLIIGTKSPATWIADLSQTERPSEGTLIDTSVYAGLILAGLLVLTRRRINWQSVFANNRWLILFFLYTGLSLLWSDRPFGSLKLWIKDVGNIVMVLVILSERDPVESVKVTFLRWGYVLVTLSMLLVKYFPEFGRAYDRWTYRPVMVGANSDKNALGATLLVCALGLFWSFLVLRRTQSRDKAALGGHLAMMAMTGWLLFKAHSATSLVCSVLGATILVVMKFPSVQHSVKRMGLTVFIAAPLIVVGLEFALDLAEVLLATLGRDLTLTSRTRIWELCLKSDINPLLGAGYSSFWHSDGAKSISEQLGFFFELREAHNGYIETYLNCGFIGLFLLLLAIGANARRILDRLNKEDSYQTFRLALVTVALVYNFTEAAFSGLHQVWFILLLGLIHYPVRPRSTQSNPLNKQTMQHEPNAVLQST